MIDRRVRHLLTELANWHPTPSTNGVLLSDRAEAGATERHGRARRRLLSGARLVPLHG